MADTYIIKEIETQADLEYAFGRKSLFKAQFDEVGTILDMWADMLESQAHKGQSFSNTLLAYLDVHKGENVKIFVKDLHTTGILSDSREMLFVRRADVTMTLYIAKQGKDLYVSWRAFLKLPPDWLKVIPWAIFSLALMTFIMGPIEYIMYGNRSISFLQVIIRTLVAAFVAGLPTLIALLWGYYRRYGDIFAFFRRPLNEFHIDDIMSLTNYVHSGVIAAADSIGVEEAKLEVKEPLYKKRRRPRI